MLDISRPSLFRLKKEMEEQLHAEERDLRSTSLTYSTSRSHRKRNYSYSGSSQAKIVVPAAKSPKKRGRNLSKTFSEEVDNAVRHQFYVLLTEKIYPTVEILFNRLQT
ncbi:unnamed protein product, partial [Rotaria sp. Silwood2]